MRLKNRENLKTCDHIVPQRSFKSMIDNKPSPEWHTLNKVWCCDPCNAYKGQLRPLDWLVIMPSNEGATRLGNRLMQLGCNIDDVSEAMGRRKGKR